MIVYGHRGAKGEAPENTIAGARHAVSRGVQHLEIDLRLSADNKLVVVHDASVTRTVGQKGRVSKLKASELGKMDARADGPPWPNRRQTGIPTLSKLVDALPEIRHWQLELKSGSKRYNENLVDAVVDWLEERNLDKNFVVTSSTPSLLAVVRHFRPKQETGLVCTTHTPPAMLEAHGCRYCIAHWSTLVQPTVVRSLRRKGIHVSAWTVNDASVIKRLWDLKVDSVITDYPSMALPLVASLQRKRG